MLSIRFAVASLILMSLFACGGSYEAPPTSPSPTPSPMPTPGGPASSVVIPVGA